MLIPQPSPARIPFTPAYFQKLQADFDRLTLERAEVMKRLQTAREMGDLSENGAYKYAKFELGNIGRQLSQLKFFLENGYVPPKKASTQVEFGCTVELQTNEKTVSYVMVSQYESDPQQNKLSMESPIGAALMNKRVGDQVTVTIPSGQKEFKILAVS